MKLLRGRHVDYNTHSLHVPPCCPPRCGVNEHLDRSPVVGVFAFPNMEMLQAGDFTFFGREPRLQRVDHYYNLVVYFMLPQANHATELIWDIHPVSGP